MDLVRGFLGPRLFGTVVDALSLVSHGIPNEISSHKPVKRALPVASNTPVGAPNAQGGRRGGVWGYPKKDCDNFMFSYHFHAASWRAFGIS